MRKFTFAEVTSVGLKAGLEKAIKLTILVSLLAAPSALAQTFGAQTFGGVLTPRADLAGPFYLTRVLDGDTFIVDLDTYQDVVDLIAVDALEHPDLNLFLGRLLGGQRLWLELDEFNRDFDGDIMAYVYVEDTMGDWYWRGLRLTQINKFLIESGLGAQASSINVRYQDIYDNIPANIRYVEAESLASRLNAYMFVDLESDTINRRFFKRYF
ncbi:MAG: hypothetical protein AAF708_05245 [Deinococcota bacterium]